MLPYNSPQEMWFSLFVIFTIAGLTAYYADQKGRSVIAWFFLGLLLGIFAPIILFFLPSLGTEEPTMTVSPPSLHLPENKQEIQSPYFNSPEENKLWYYLDAKHQQYGPVSLLGLKDLWDTGQLSLDSYVWSEGMKEWEKVENLHHLKEALKVYRG